MNYAYFKIGGAAVLLVLLITFSVLGFAATKPGATQKNIDAFWICMLIFLLLLALYIFFFFSRLLAVAPLFPFILFLRLFLLTRKKNG